MKKFIGFIVFASVLGAGIATAQNDPVAPRKAVLKGFGEAAKPIGAMMKGETPFDAATVQKSLTTIADGAKKLPGMFPDSSKTGDTAALPKIWDEKAKVDAIFAKLAADATAAAASIKDEASFKASIGGVLGNCKACHDDYRAKKS